MVRAVRLPQVRQAFEQNESTTMSLLKHLRIAAVLAALTLIFPAMASEGLVPEIRTRTDTYKNVTLVSHNATHVFVQHSRGMATLKVGDLSREVLIGLRVLEPDPVLATGEEATEAAEPMDMAALQASFSESLKNGTAPKLENLNLAGLIKEMPPELKRNLLIALVGAFFLHLFFSFCSMLICKKAGTEPGLLVWLPLLQLIPLIRAAGMSGWWFLGWFVPVLNIVASILWCVNIAKARGKGVLTTIMLILPVTNILAFLYLAFSAGEGSSDDGESSGRIRFEPLPA
jgi:hypothetical protein